MTLSPTAQDQRASDILASVRSAFAEKGFDGASMQDLARAAGMSVGNFYRYFPSKAAIVQAMCGYDLAEIQGEFAEIQTADQPMICLRDRILNHFSEESMKDGQLWAEITAAAIRKPEIGEAARQMEDTIVSLLATIFAHTTRIDTFRQLETLTDYPPAVAKFLRRVSRVRIERLLYRIL